MGIYVEDIGKVYITGAGYVNRSFSTGRDSIGWNETVWGGKLNRSKNTSNSSSNDHRSDWLAIHRTTRV